MCSFNDVTAVIQMIIDSGQSGCRSRTGESDNRAICQGPFASCVKVVKDYFHSVTKILTNVDHEAWKNVLAQNFMQYDAALDINPPDLFVTLKLLEDAVMEACEIADIEIGVHKQDFHSRSTPRGIRDNILLRTAVLRRKLLAHPINIVLAAFLVGDQCLFDYDKVCNRIDPTTRKPLWTPRTGLSFIKDFPYDYLACVYKISFEYFVNKRHEAPNAKWFKDQGDMAIFNQRASEDIREVRHGLVTLHALLIFVALYFIRCR